ncbi:MAG: hypothetical protein KGZ39_00110 [Simkania sp.]|nr:hypothetical protein [Simkania sp.]
MSRLAVLTLLQDVKQFIQEEAQQRPYLFSSTPIYSPFPSTPIVIRNTPRLFPKKSEEQPTPTPPVENITVSEEIKKEDPLPPPPTQAPLIDSLRIAIEKSCPHLHLKSIIPNDDEALQRKNAWKHREHQVRVLILSFTRTSLEKTFLDNVAKTISTLHCKAQVIHALEVEKERSWKALLELPQLAVVFAPLLDSWKTPFLKSLVIQHPSTAEFHLGKARLHFLPPIEKVFDDPLNKRKLWQWIGQKLQ